MIPVSSIPIKVLGNLGERRTKAAALSSQSLWPSHTYAPLKPSTHVCYGIPDRPFTSLLHNG